MDNPDRAVPAAPADDEPATDDRDAMTVWDAGAAALRTQLAEATWHAWFQGVRAVRLDGDVLVLAVPSTVACERIRSSYRGLLDDCLRDATGRDIHVELLVDTGARPPEQLDLDDAPVVAPEAPVAAGRSETTWASGTLNERYTFDQFVIGASNRFAHAAALSVAEAPAQAYNPLFIYGPAGLGKTHLLHAIGHHVRAMFPRKRVRYVSTESFMNDFVEAIRDRTRMPVFKRRYRELDVLLIDDIQFLERTQELQEEFFHTFNQIHNEGGQIVISSDRSPKSIATLEDRLRSRFEWGLIADIGTPDLETRIAIVRTKAEELGVTISGEAIEFLARKVASNIRELEGALNRISAYATMQGLPITPDLAQAVLSNVLYNPRKRAVTTERIARAVSEYYTVELDALRGQKRDRAIVTPRQIAMYLMRAETDVSLLRIGAELGGRDHSTVLHACDKIEKELQRNEELRRELEAVRELIYAD